MPFRSKPHFIFWICLLIFLFSTDAAPTLAAPVVISKAELWNGINNLHAAEGVTLEGDGSVLHPYTYVIPNGLTITSIGTLRFGTAANFVLRFLSGGITIQPGGRIDLSKGADRLGSYQCIFDLGGYDLAGEGRFMTSGRGALWLQIENVRNVSLLAISLRRDDAAAAPVIILASESVRVSGEIDLTDGNAGGNQGGNLTIIAGSIEVGEIRTGSMRTSSETTNGTIKLEALAYPDFNPNNYRANSLTNAILLSGKINTSGALSTHKGGNVYIQGVKITLGPAFQLLLPATGLYSIKAGIPQGAVDEKSLFVDQVPGGSGLAANHLVQWSFPGFRVTHTQPVDESGMIELPEEISFGLSKPVLTTSLDPSDCTIDEQPAAGFRWIHDRLIAFELPDLPATAGYHSFNIIGGSFQSQDGQPIEAYRGQLRILAPPTISNQQVRKVSSSGASLGAEITQSPRIRIYYGRQDGGTDPDEWEDWRDGGEFPDGPVQVTLYGLDPDTPYFSRLYASNAAGSNWAGESLSFRTNSQSDAFDKETVALWLFDEIHYPYTTLTDAGPGLYDLRLMESAQLVPGRFGNALKLQSSSSYNVQFSGWKGIVCANKMAAPPYSPSGLWGPTISPKNLLTTLALTDWTIELWLHSNVKPATETTLLSLGYGYDPGFSIVWHSAGERFHVVNAYAGTQSECPSMANPLFDGKWHHLAFTWSAAGKELQLFLDGEIQGTATNTLIPFQSVPPTVIPSSLASTDFGIFDTSMNYEKFRQNRFNLALGEERKGSGIFNALIDEIRVSNTNRYPQAFSIPDSFSRSYREISPPPSLPQNPPLLFPSKPPTGPLAFGQRRHVFIDESIIETKENITFRVNPPVNPLQTNVNFGGDYTAVDYNGSIYTIVPDSYASNEGITRLYRSSNGLSFQSPDLGVVEYRGSTHNNIILYLLPMWASVFEDRNPDTPPEDRFKLTAWLSNAGSYLFTSPDLVHWRRNENSMLPLVSGGNVESFWDDQNGVYRCYLKRDPNMHSISCPPAGGRAAVGFRTRQILRPFPFRPIDPPFFEYWTIPNVTCEGPVDFPVTNEGEVYRTRVIKYPWAPDVYLAFVWRFGPSQVRQTELVVSRDGDTWTSLSQYGMYLPTGESYLGRIIVERLAQNGLIRRNDEIWQYAEFNTGPHGQGEKFCVRVQQRLDGFTALEAGSATGTLTTRPLVFDGNELLLNVLAEGGVKAGFLDETGLPFPGFGLDECDPIREDSTSVPISWQGRRDLSSLAGKTVRVRFELVNSKLFAFEIHQNPLLVTPTPTPTLSPTQSATPTPTEAHSGIGLWSFQK